MTALKHCDTIKCVAGTAVRIYGMGLRMGCSMDLHKLT